jgi:hypothetical protein
LEESCVSGTLLIQSESLENVSLPALSVACHVAVVESPSLASLTLDGLTRVDGLLSLYHAENLSSVSMSELEVVEGNFDMTRAEALQDMSGFGSLQSVGGALLLTLNGSLSSLTGIESLTDIGGGIGIQSCDALETLDGLDGLASLGGGVFIRFCDVLADICALASVADWSAGLHLHHTPVEDIDCLAGLAGTTEMGTLVIDDTAISSLAVLEGLSVVEGDLSISGNNNLVGVDPLSGLTWVGERFDIEESPLVEELTFPSLEYVGNMMMFHQLPSAVQIRLDALPSAKDIQVYECPALETLALPSLTETEMDLFINENQALMELDAASLVSIGVDLWVCDTSLTTLDGLAALEDLGEDLRCLSNTALPTCEATELRDRLIANGWTGEADIWGNLPDECGE